MWWHWCRRRHRERTGAGKWAGWAMALSLPSMIGVVVVVVVASGQGANGWVQIQVMHGRATVTACACEGKGDHGVGVPSGIAIVAMVMSPLLSLRGGASVVDGIVIVARVHEQAGGRKWVGWMASTNGTWLCALGCDEGGGHVVIYLTGVSAIVVLWSNVASSTASSDT
ncbi:hypothetical protein EV363DRAFT_1295723 [Boletus edulis]|nr:hypothetical protein EV363DRAFT_1295723 [Boletus edulis]